MSISRATLVVCCALLIPTSSWAGVQPTTVSPGSAAGSPIGDTCPTFSWATVAEATAYELVVYRVGPGGDERSPLIRKTLAGSVSSWTPSLDHCLERGGHYAWSVGARGLELSEWSPPSFFSVTSGLSQADFEDALTTIRHYLLDRDAARPGEDIGQSIEPEPLSGQQASDLSPAPRAAAETAMDVEGGVVAASFTGDGTGLTSVTAQDLVGTACISESELDFDPVTQSEMVTHAGLPAAHHAPTLNTTCDGIACDGTLFSNLQWSNLENLPGGFDDDTDNACSIADNGDGTASITCNDGTSATVGIGIDIAQISCGESYSCVLVPADSSCRACWEYVHCWGNDGYGQASPPEGSFIQIATGRNHTCGLRADGSLKCWGYNEFGKTSVPAGTYKYVATGVFTTCAVKDDDSVACWGGDNSGTTSPAAGTYKTVSVGGWHACGLKMDDTVTCWGWNPSGQATPPSGTFNQLELGYDHSCGVRSDETAVCWGSDGSNEVTDTPAGSFSKVLGSRFFSCGLKTDDTVVCWGDNTDGQATAPAGLFSDISTFGNHVCGVKQNGGLECWGKDHWGQVSYVPPALR